MLANTLVKTADAITTIPVHITTYALVCHLNSTHQNKLIDSLFACACQQVSFVLDVNPNISLFMLSIPQ